MTLGAFITAVLAAAIPATWFFIVRWFMSKDVAETELLDEADLAELPPIQKAAARTPERDDAHMPHLTHAGAH